MNNTIVVGVDVGGSHITAALVNLSTYTLLEESCVRREINTRGEASEIIRDWSDVIEKVISEHKGFSGKIGIAMPGPFNYQGGVSLMKDQNKYDSLFNLNVKELLALNMKMRAQDIRFFNDAECFLQGEVFCGTARGYKRALGLTLGTGLGSAKCVEGEVVDADLWNSPFLEGIAEDYLSTRWFVKSYQQLSGIQVSGVKELAELADSDPGIQVIFNEFGENLAKFLCFFISLENPDIVVIGGNIAKAHALFFPELEKQLWERGIQVPVKIAELGEEAALVGAASCWVESRKEQLL